jgi:hypothetical protein
MWTHHYLLYEILSLRAKAKSLGLCGGGVRSVTSRRARRRRDLEPISVLAHNPCGIAVSRVVIMQRSGACFCVGSVCLARRCSSNKVNFSATSCSHEVQAVSPPMTSPPPDHGQTIDRPSTDHAALVRRKAEELTPRLARCHTLVQRKKTTRRISAADAQRQEFAISRISFKFSAGSLLLTIPR